MDKAQIKPKEKHGRHILTIALSDYENLNVSLSDYKGEILISIRIWSKAVGNKAWLPTPRGISLKPELLLQIIQALQKINKWTKGRK